MSAVPEATAVEPLFRGAQQAIMFAMRFSSEQYQKSAMSQMSGPSGGGSGKGLGGLDGAAQAGLIISIVRRNVSDLHFAVLTARCSPHRSACSCGSPCCSKAKPNWFWEEAITRIVSASVAEFPGALTKRGLIEAMIKRFFKFSDGRTDAALAKFYDVNRDTIPAYRARIELWMYGEKETKKVKLPKKGLEMRAWEEADAVLQQAGII
jgi:hypothetical protein